jgi:hypothetical protein
MQDGFDPYDPNIIDAEFEVIDDEETNRIEERIFQERARNIEKNMDPNVRWEIGPGGEIRKKNL